MRAFLGENIRRGTNAQGPSSRRISRGYLVVRDYAPVPMVSSLGRFPACATYEVEVTRDYATGETFGVSGEI